MRMRCTVAELCMKKRWLADRWLVVVIICQSPALAVQRSQRSVRCCLVTLRSCGVATRPAVDRDPKTRLRNAIAPACRPYLSPSTCSRPLSFCSMWYEQLSLSHRPSLQSLTSVVVGEMLRRSETYPRRLVSSRLVLDLGMKIVYEPLLDGREATVVHAVLVSWQQTSSGQLQWSQWIGFQDRWCFSSVSFVCGVTSCPWFRPLS